MNETVPVLQITDTWAVDDLKTPEECRDAIDMLSEAIFAIEAAIATDAQTRERGEEWRIRARTALKWKKAARQRVFQIQSELVRKARAEAAKVHREADERGLLQFIREHEPEAFYRAVGKWKAMALGSTLTQEQTVK